MVVGISTSDRRCPLDQRRGLSVGHPHRRRRIWESDEPSTRRDIGGIDGIPPPPTGHWRVRDSARGTRRSPHCKVIIGLERHHIIFHRHIHITHPSSCLVDNDVGVRHRHVGPWGLRARDAVRMPRSVHVDVAIVFGFGVWP